MKPNHTFRKASGTEVEKHENQLNVKEMSVCKLPNVCLMDR